MTSTTSEFTSRARAALTKKTAALNPGVKLQPHQADAVKRSATSSGMVLNWGLGSGKTLGSIAVAEAKGGNVLVVTPAALRENFQGQLREHVSPLRHGAYTVISYDEFRRDPEGWVARARPTTIIADEFHRLRNPGPREPFDKVRGKVKFMLGLTGSMINNRPEEIVPLVNLAAGKPVFESIEDFKRQHIDEKQIPVGLWGRLRGVKPGVEESLKNKAGLGTKLSPVVHRFTGNEAYQRELPTVSESVVTVPMSPGQEQMMKALSSKNPILAYKLKNNLPPSKKDLKSMNSFMAAARQISNNPSLYTTKAMESPKFKAMLDDIVSQSRGNKAFKTVIYSNFIESGVQPLIDELNRRKIPSAAFTGSLNDAQRRQMVADFNAGRLRVLGLSPAGGEGLDLKGVRLVQLTEEHWNPERGNQAVGRSARFRSHAHLPEDERNVEVRRYMTAHNKSLVNKVFRTKPPMSPDQWIDERRREKKELNKQFMSAVPEYSSG